MYAVGVRVKIQVHQPAYLSEISTRVSDVDYLVAHISNTGQRIFYHTHGLWKTFK